MKKIFLILFISSVSQLTYPMINPLFIDSVSSDIIFKNAIASGDIKALSNLIQKKYYINTTFEDKKTGLHISVGNNDSEIVKLLLANGANINAIDNKGMTPLHYAIEQQNLDIINLLLESEQINVNYNSVIKGTPLFQAVNLGNIEIVKILISRSADINKQFEKSIPEDNRSLLSKLISKKTILITPLELAIEKNFTDIASLIMKQPWCGIDSDYILNAVISGICSPKILVTLSEVRSINCKDVCIKIINTGKIEILREFIQAMNINLDNDTYPLNHALVNYSKHNTNLSQAYILELISMLSLVTPNDKNRYNYLINAINTRDAVIIEALLKKGYSPNIKVDYHQNQEFVFPNTNTGIHLLNFAIAQYLEDIAMLLIEYGADINTSDNVSHNENMSSASISILRNNLIVFKKLIELGSKDTVFDLLDFYLRCNYKPIEFLAILIEQGAPITNIPAYLICELKEYNKELHELVINTNKLFEAITNNDINEVISLLKLNFPLKLKGEYGYNALMYAVKNGNIDIVRLLINQDLDLQDKFGNTCLHIAAYTGNIDIIMLLLNEGSKISLTKDGYSPIVAAAFNGHNHVLDFFYNLYGNDFYKLENISILLKVAIAKNKEETAKWLISKGAIITPSALIAFPDILDN